MTTNGKGKDQNNKNDDLNYLHEEKKNSEDNAGVYPLEHVPLEAKKNFFPILSILLGFTFFSPTIIAGATIGSNFDMSTLLLICLAGNLVLGVYGGLLCKIGASTGLGAVMLSRYTLGRVGVKWADLLLGGTELGWYAVNANFIGGLYAEALGQPDKVVLWTVIWGVVMAITAIYGFKAVSIIAYASLPMIVVLVGLMPILAVKEVGSLSAIFEISAVSRDMSVSTAMTMIMGTFAAGATQANNWSKFNRTGKEGFWAGFIAFFVGNALMILVGMIAAIAFQKSDITVIFKDMGILWLAIIILTFNIWSTNNAGASAVGFAASEFFGKDRYRMYITVGIGAAIVLGASGVYAYFIPFLVMLGTVIPPLGGTIIGDYFFTWKGRLPKIEYVESFKLFRISTVVSYILGVLVSIITNTINWGMPSLQGIIVSALCVPVINIILKKVGINDTHEIKTNPEFTD
ncbi:MAG: cytosine permease [Tissierellia bacterium]|nr:cytosine permease [Tissierellia bacterium]